MMTVMTVMTMMTLITQNVSRISLVMLLLPFCHVFAHTDRLLFLIHTCSFRARASLCERIMGHVISVITVITVIIVITVITRSTLDWLLFFLLFFVVDFHAMAAIDCCDGSPQRPQGSARQRV